MIEVYTIRNCTSCSIAKVALQMSDIEFKEFKNGHIDSKGYPYFINTKNNRTYSGWPSTIKQLIKELRIA
jgi:arsenate reductase-like glutaredoxin family protein